MTEKAIGNPMKDPNDWLRPEIANLILDEAQSHDLRNWLILILLLRTGRRVGELVQLKPKDISWKEGLVLWHIEKKTQPVKDDQGRVVTKMDLNGNEKPMREKKDHRSWKALDSYSLSKLKEYIESDDIKPDEYVFYSPYKGRNNHLSRQAVWAFLSKYGKKLSIEVHPHTFRHTFSVWIAQNMKSPADLIKLKDLLEHSDVKITESYLQFSAAASKDLLEKTFNKSESE